MPWFRLPVVELAPLSPPFLTPPSQVGYAGENFPRAIFPSMVGRPVLRAEEAVAEGVELKDIMCGDEAAAVRHSLECSYPVENGIVKNWDDMEEVRRRCIIRALSPSFTPELYPRALPRALSNTPFAALELHVLGEDED